MLNKEWQQCDGYDMGVFHLIWEMKRTYMIFCNLTRMCKDGPAVSFKGAPITAAVTAWAMKRWSSALTPGG